MTIPCVVESVKPQNPVLSLTTTQELCLTYPNGKTVTLKNNALTAWQLRTGFTALNATPAAQQWFLQHNPLKPLSSTLLASKLLPHQILGVNRMLINPSCMWWDMGTGKTLTALAHALELYQQNPHNNKFLILCPLSVFENWKDEITKHIKPEAHAKFILAHGRKRTSALCDVKTLYADELCFVSTTYDTLISIKDNLVSIPFAACYADEASNVCYMETQKTKTLFSFLEQNRSPIFNLSGTPSTTKIEGYYALYELLGKGRSGSSTIWHFKNQYEESRKFIVLDIPTTTGFEKKHVYAEGNGPVNWLCRNCPPNSVQSYMDLGYTIERQVKGPKQLRISHAYQKTIGVKNIAELNALTRENAYTVTKEEVIADLPEKTYQLRNLAMTSEQLKAYEEILTECRTIIDGTKFYFNNLCPFCKLHEIANGFLRKNDNVVYFKQQPKLDELFSIIDEAGVQKVVVWSPMIPQISQIAARLKREKIEFVTITGSVTGSKRITEIERFKTDPNCRIFLGNPAAAGLGLNLQCACLEVFMANWYRPNIRAQAEDRCHRAGQKNAVTIVDLVTSGTIEKRILSNLQRQIDLEGQILSMRDLTGETA